MVASVGEFGITVLALEHRSLILRFFHVNLVLDKDIFTEVGRQISRALNTDNIVDATVKQVFRSIGEILIRQFFVSISINWNDVNVKLAMILIVASN